MAKIYPYIIPSLAILCVSFYVAALLYGIPFQNPQLVFGKGRIAALHPGEDSPHGPYKIFYVYNAASCDRAEEDYRTGKSKIHPDQLERIVYFFAYGNKGHKFQFQPIANSLHEYLRLVDKYSTTHCFAAYFLDFSGEPTAFSRDMIDRQAAYFAEAVKRVMETEAEGRHKSAKFNIVAHSMGAYVAYKAM